MAQNYAACSTPALHWFLTSGGLLEAKADESKGRVLWCSFGEGRFPSIHLYSNWLEQMMIIRRDGPRERVSWMLEYCVGEYLAWFGFFFWEYWNIMEYSWIFSDYSYSGIYISTHIAYAITWFYDMIRCLMFSSCILYSGSQVGVWSPEQLC